MLGLCSCLLLPQDAETTGECAARLKAGTSSSESDGAGDQCWRGLDRLVCVDSTWQQATGIMKVSALSIVIIIIIIYYDCQDERINSLPSVKLTDAKTYFWRYVCHNKNY